MAMLHSQKHGQKLNWLQDLAQNYLLFPNLQQNGENQLYSSEISGVKEGTNATKQNQRLLKDRCYSMAPSLLSTIQR